LYPSTLDKIEESEIDKISKKPEFSMKNLLNNEDYSLGCANVIYGTLKFAFDFLENHKMF